VCVCTRTYNCILQNIEKIISILFWDKREERRERRRRRQYTWWRHKNGRN